MQQVRTWSCRHAAILQAAAHQCSLANFFRNSFFGACLLKAGPTGIPTAEIPAAVENMPAAHRFRYRNTSRAASVSLLLRAASTTDMSINYRANAKCSPSRTPYAGRPKICAQDRAILARAPVLQCASSARQSWFPERSQVATAAPGCRRIAHGQAR